MNNPELSRDNPRFLELTAAYRNLNLFEHSLWQTWADNIDIQNFRGEHAFISTWYGMTEERYQNTYEYLVEIGESETIARLGEDGKFGAVVHQSPDGVAFSRDLLDCVCELRFLKETLGLSEQSWTRLLDVGAGYGRLLHRYAQLFPQANGYAVDAVPLSTFLCDYYLYHRGVSARMETVPLHEIGSIMTADVAVNAYSFSEMPLSAIRFWLDFCADHNIGYFFLVPHSGDLLHPHFVTSEPDGSHLNYLPEFERHGYKLKVQRPKFPRERAHELIYPTDYLLFERG